MSCNPSIGGIGKGHLVKEVDSLGGLMGQIIDRAGIHFKMLNVRKGPAVRGPRAQADRDLYKSEMQAILSQCPNLSILEASVEDLIIDGDIGSGSNMNVLGIKLQDNSIVRADCVVITTGTFLRGKCYLGKKSYAAGRHLRDSDEVEPPSIGLAATLHKLNFDIGRLKTGTPPRLSAKSINWESLSKQASDDPPIPFSYLNINSGVKLKRNLIQCAMTYTTEKTHELVMKYADLLPDYDGANGDGVGPRYCPSIYKKVQRFPDRNRHLIWLEPEGLNTDFIYPNGLSGPYPPEIQTLIARTIPGLENVEIVRPGYDVEYDFVDPRSLLHSMETKKVRGLFLAGQICGTTGYEEAAAQGIVAGINAGLQARSTFQSQPFVIGRDEGYIGVLIDDLVCKGTNEPYRMFTSRAEYRLSLRQDNADIRLTRKGIDVGIIDDERKELFQDRVTKIESALATLRSVSLHRTQWNLLAPEYQMSIRDGKHRTAIDVLSMPNVTLAQMITSIRQLALAGKIDNELTNFEVDDSVFDTVEADAKYDCYLQLQDAEVEKWKRNGFLKIPSDIVYSHEAFPSLSSEEIERLNAVKPCTLHDASQIQGLTPHALVYLHLYISKFSRKRRSSHDVFPAEVNN